MLMGVGTDIIEIERITKASANERFIKRIYTAAEQDYCLNRQNPYPCLAGRFAAKEAVLKALGTGLAGCRFKDVEILPNEKGAPTVTLHGAAKQAALARGIANIMVSISHDQTSAIAFAVAVNGSDVHESGYGGRNGEY